MNIIAVDDEPLALKGLICSIQKAVPHATVCGFDNGKDALTYAKKNPCHVAFLDIQMGGINGLELARRLYEQRPNTNIIFVTGYTEYAADAFELFASGYVMKPVSGEDITKQIENLRYAIAEEQKPVKVQCFGNFEVYLYGVPVEFGYAKAKEMFAYLVDRNGALCSNHEIIAALWEEDISESYFRNVRLDLLKSLPKKIFVRQRGKISLKKNQIICDYYDYLAGNHKPTIVSEYMSQYTWSEARLGQLLCQLNESMDEESEK